jgi:hypothetical protein
MTHIKSILKWWIDWLNYLQCCKASEQVNPLTPADQLLYIQLTILNYEERHGKRRI